MQASNLFSLNPYPNNIEFSEEIFITSISKLHIYYINTFKNNLLIKTYASCCIECKSNSNSFSRLLVTIHTIVRVLFSA